MKRESRLQTLHFSLQSTSAWGERDMGTSDRSTLASNNLMLFPVNAYGIADQTDTMCRELATCHMM